jgi:hypothetical protein
MGRHNASADATRGRRFALANAMGREGLEPSTLRLRGWLGVYGPLRLFGLSRIA